MTSFLEKLGNIFSASCTPFESLPPAPDIEQFSKMQMRSLTSCSCYVITRGMWLRGSAYHELRRGRRESSALKAEGGESLSLELL